MADYKVIDTELTSIANAIRTKGGTQSQLVFPTGFVSAINAIPSGGGSANILTGIHHPDSSIGNDGAIYLRYTLGGIKNDVNQYIKTGYSANANTKIVVDFEVTKYIGTTYPTIFGGRPYAANTDNAVAFYGNGYGTSASIAWHIQEEVSGIGLADLTNKIAHVELSNGLFIITAPGINRTINLTPFAITSSTEILIFRHGVNGNPSTGFDTRADGVILYNFEAYENNTLIHKFTPAKDQNDVVCLYDEIGQEYIYHDGGGVLEYIEKDVITGAYLKVNGTWQSLIGSDVNDVNTGGN